MTVLTMNIVGDDDTTGIMRGYLVHQKKPGKGGDIRGKAAGEKGCGNLSYRAGKQLSAASASGRQRFRRARIPHREIFLSGKMSCGGGNNGKMVYITFLLAADNLTNLRDGGCAGADAPEEQSQYVNQT